MGSGTNTGMILPLDIEQYVDFTRFIRDLESRAKIKINYLHHNLSRPAYFDENSWDKEQAKMLISNKYGVKLTLDFLSDLEFQTTENNQFLELLAYDSRRKMRFLVSPISSAHLISHVQGFPTLPTDPLTDIIKAEIVRLEEVKEIIEDQTGFNRNRLTGVVVYQKRSLDS